MIVVGIIGLFTGVGLVEDAFADHEFDIKKIKEGRHQSTIIVFTHPIELTDKNDGFEFLRNGEITSGFAKKRTNDSVIQFKFDDRLHPKDTLFTLNYNGSSNNLQYDGKPVPSFSLSKQDNSYGIYEIIEHPTFVDETKPFFKILKDDRIYSESKFYRFQQSNDIVPGTIIDIQDESHTRQTIETKYINSQLTAITYKVIDTFNNTSSITEAVFIGTGFFDGRFHFEVEYPQHSFSGDYMYNTDHVDPIANIIGISQTNQRYDIAIVTSEDANSKTKFYVDYLVMWFNEGNMRQITGTILTYSDDADHDGIKNKKDNCKLRAGPIENFGCPTSFIDYRNN